MFRVWGYGCGWVCGCGWVFCLFVFVLHVWFGLTLALTSNLKNHNNKTLCWSLLTPFHCWFYTGRRSRPHSVSDYTSLTKILFLKHELRVTIMVDSTFASLYDVSWARLFQSWLQLPGSDSIRSIHSSDLSVCSCSSTDHITPVTNVTGFMVDCSGSGHGSL